MIVECSVSQLADYPTCERWAIVRHAMYRQAAWRQQGVLWVPSLSPSARLLGWWRDRIACAPESDLPAAWAEHVARWRTEKAGDARYGRALRRAVEVARMGHLAVACWCSDERMCHRALVLADVRAALRVGAA